jgi:tRNA-splicing ligase RtcB
MGNIKAKELSKLGFTDNVARSVAIELVAKNCKHFSNEKICELLQNIKQCPEQYKQDAVWGKLAQILSPD